MHKIVHAFAASLAALSVLPAGAQALGHFVDAAQFDIDYAAGTLALDSAPTSEQKLAQTITVVAGGTLAGVFVPVICGRGRVVVELRDVFKGLPGSVVLSQSIVAPTDFHPAGRFSFVPMPGNVALAVGQEVALVLSNPRGACSVHMSPLASSYAGGQAFFDARPNPPGWIPFSDFPGTPDDLPFQLVLE
jgi:hypothetical protein